MSRYTARTTPRGGGGTESIAGARLFRTIISVDLFVFSLRLLLAAHCPTWVNSAVIVWLLDAGTSRYVSSVYLHVCILLPDTDGLKSEAFLMKAIGPMSEPWTMLALISSGVDVASLHLVQWDRRCK